MFDYIIIGAGAAGLMLADAMGKDVFFSNKSILLLDKDPKNTNDRTWCFWEKGNGAFDPIVDRMWPNVFFGGKTHSKTYDIAPYSYKMIKGITFYKTYKERLQGYSNIVFEQEEVLRAEDHGTKVTVTTVDGTYSAKKVFNSIFDYKMITAQQKYPVLQQHFVGWYVKTENPIFRTDTATYMDFAIPQKGNTRFMYILPFSENEALVEYTLFSEKRLPLDAYETALQAYLKNNLGSGEYEITDVEKGSIPMTAYEFREHHTKNMRYIGTAGGWAKPSTGYTFLSTAKKIPRLLEYIKSGADLRTLRYRNKFWYYDLLLLDVLSHDNSIGQSVFETLFKNRSPQFIFKFLDEETNFFEDVRYMTSVKSGPFIKAIIRRLF